MSAQTMEDFRIRTVAGRAVPVRGDDIDTDRVIPARFMKCVTFAELGQYAFYDARFNEDGSRKEHSFNKPEFQGANILIVNRNFGCGSSREHAPQSLMRWGIKAIVGESFAEIFADNCGAIGIPAVTASGADIQKLMTAVEKNPKAEVKVDLEKKSVSFDGESISVQMPEQTRHALTQGTWDSTAELISAKDETKSVADKLPYNRSFQ